VYIICLYSIPKNFPHGCLVCIGSRAANPRHGKGCGGTQHHSYWCGAFFGKGHEETNVLHAASLVEDGTNQIYD
jgi:hypothetical protein